VGDSLVSVIINCLNGEKFLREAIDSVYAQTYNNWEIILWDNASTDKTAEIGQSYDSKIKYYKSEKVIPLGDARNKALKQCKGEFIAILDCDDIWAPDKLEKQIPLFKESSIGLVFCDCIFFKAGGKEWRHYSKRRPYIGNCFRQLLTDFSLVLSTVVIRTSVFKNLDEHFDTRFNVLEDADLFRRIAFYWEVDFVNEPLAKWRVHKDSWTWSKTDLFITENEMLLEKFKSVIPRFEEDYAAEIQQLTKTVNIKKARQHWSEGDGRLARKELIKNMPDIKSLALYIISFFPVRVGERLITIFRGDFSAN